MMTTKKHENISKHAICSDSRNFPDLLQLQQVLWTIKIQIYGKSTLFTNLEEIFLKIFLQN